jgi:hypothetical protein
VLLTITNAHSVVFQAKERLVLPAVASSVGTAAQLALILVLSTRTDALVPYMVPSVLAALVEFIVLVPAVRRLVPLRYGVDLKLWRRLLAEAVPISVGSAMATLYYRVDGVMLSQLASLTDVAIYGVAYKFVDIVHVVPWAVSTAALPRLVKRWPDAVPPSRRGATRGAAAGGDRVVLAEFEAPRRRWCPSWHGEAVRRCGVPAHRRAVECHNPSPAPSLLGRSSPLPTIGATPGSRRPGRSQREPQPVLISRGVVGAVSPPSSPTHRGDPAHGAAASRRVLRGTRGWRLGRWPWPPRSPPAGLLPGCPGSSPRPWPGRCTSVSCWPRTSDREGGAACSTPTRGLPGPGTG